jgi:hypothetical protein
VLRRSTSAKGVRAPGSRDVFGPVEGAEPSLRSEMRISQPSARPMMEMTLPGGATSQ